MKRNMCHRRFLPHAGIDSGAGLLATVVVPGCGSSSAPEASPGAAKVKVGYLGLTCEAAMFVAYEKGFFKDEGLDIEFVKTDWDGLRDGLGLGRFDANYTLIMYLLKPIEQGLDVKITGGVHSGCLRVQAGLKGPIQSVSDLKGKKIGVPTHLGSPPFLFASRVLAAKGINPNKDVDWVVLPPEVLGLALDNGQVDAVANSEPIGSILTAEGKVRTIADQAVDPPYNRRVLLRGRGQRGVHQAEPIGRGPGHAGVAQRCSLGRSEPGCRSSAFGREAIHRSLDRGQRPRDLEAQVRPGVSRCRTSLDSAAAEMKSAGLLNPSTDPAELAKRAWLDLDGVSDEWIKGLKVEHVAGGGPPPPLDNRAFVALLTGQPVSCCNGK